MKKTTKLLAVVLSAMMLLVPLSTTVFAMDMANILGIDLDGILGALGGALSGRVKKRRFLHSWQNTARV